MLIVKIIIIKKDIDLKEIMSKIVYEHENAHKPP